MVLIKIIPLLCFLLIRGGFMANPLIKSYDNINQNFTNKKSSNNLTDSDFEPFNGIFNNEHRIINDSHHSPKIVITYFSKSKMNHTNFDPLIPFHKFFLFFLLNAHRNDLTNDYDDNNKNFAESYPSELKSSNLSVMDNANISNETNKVQSVSNDILTPDASKSSTSITNDFKSTLGNSKLSTSDYSTEGLKRFTENETNKLLTDVEIQRAVRELNITIEEVSIQSSSETSTANLMDKLTDDSNKPTEPPQTDKSNSSTLTEFETVFRPSSSLNIATSNATIQEIDVESTPQPLETVPISTIAVVVKKELKDTYFENDTTSTNIENTNATLTNESTPVVSKSVETITLFEVETQTEIKRNRRSDLHLKKNRIALLNGAADKEIEQFSETTVNGKKRVEENKDLFIVLNEIEVQSSSSSALNLDEKFDSEFENKLTTNKDDLIENELERILKPIFNGRENDIKKEFFSSNDDDSFDEKLPEFIHPIVKITLPTVLCIGFMLVVLGFFLRSSWCYHLFRQQSSIMVVTPNENKT